MRETMLILGVCASLTGCFEQPETLNAHDVLQATVDHVILPDLEVFKRTADDLHDHAQRFCIEPSASRLQTVQFSWKGGKRLLKTMELLSFGPYNFVEIDISRRLDNWPERGEGIEAMITGQEELNVDFLRSQSQADVSHGYPALGYLLYSEMDSDLQLNRLQEERRCTYLQAQTELNMEIVHDFYDAWSPSGADYASELSLAGQGSSYFISPEEAIGSILVSMNRLTQHMADIKLSQPLDMGRMDAVEAQYSGSSLRDLSSNLDAMARMYSEPSPSISDYIKAQQGADIDTSILDGLQTVRTALEKIPEPLAMSIVEEPQKVAELIVALEEFSDVLTHDAQRFVAYAP